MIWGLGSTCFSHRASAFLWQRTSVTFVGRWAPAPRLSGGLFSQARPPVCPSQQTSPPAFHISTIQSPRGLWRAVVHHRMLPTSEREVLGHCFSQTPFQCLPPAGGLESSHCHSHFVPRVSKTRTGSPLLSPAHTERTSSQRECRWILESAWQFVDLNATARNYCKLSNYIYRRFPSVSGSSCVIYVCIYSIAGFWKIFM